MVHSDWDRRIKRLNYLLKIRKMTEIENVTFSLRKYLETIYNCLKDREKY